MNAPQPIDEIDEVIGEFSVSHMANGSCAEGVTPNLAKLPSDWMDRVNKVQNENTRGDMD